MNAKVLIHPSTNGSSELPVQEELSKVLGVQTRSPWWGSRKLWSNGNKLETECSLRIQPCFGYTAKDKPCNVWKMEDISNIKISQDSRQNSYFCFLKKTGNIWTHWAYAPAQQQLARAETAALVSRSSCSSGQTPLEELSFPYNR